MTSIETKVSESILKTIRGRRSESSSDDLLQGDMSRTTSLGPVTIREALFSDFERVSEMNSRLEQGPDSPENWQRLWVENPALAEFKSEACIGWVLESGGNIVGFLGSIPLLYEFQGATLKAAATCRLAVEAAYRSHTHLLVTSFFRQKSIDLFINSTATVSAGKMMAAMKALPIPQKDYETVLFWVLDPRRFTKAVLRKMGITNGLVGAASSLGSIALRGDILIRKRLPRGKSKGYPVVDSSVSEIGEEFERFWLDWKQGSKLLAKRTPAIMRWHFDPPHNRRKISVLTTKSGNKINGYLIVRHDEDTTDGIRRSLIADMMIQENDPRILEHLLAAACRVSKEAGSHALEAIGFPRGIRQGLLKLNPYSRKYPACPFFYRTRDKLLQGKLTDENAWYASPFDGDATLWP